jgi:hypothetical protein
VVVEVVVEDVREVLDTERERGRVILRKALMEVSKVSSKFSLEMPGVERQK